MKSEFQLRFFEGVLEVEIMTSHLSFQEIVTLAFFLKTIEMFREKHVKSIVLSHQDLCKLFKVKRSTRGR